MPHTFESLAQMSRDELEEVLKTGEEPTLNEEVVGWEFQGWNVNPLTSVLGNRKFKKGYFGDPDVYLDPAQQYAWGYNMTMEQNDFNEPWVATPSPENPRRHFYWGVTQGAKANKPKYPNTMVIDYRRWPEYVPGFPVGYTVDYMIYPNPGDPLLMLGKSYLEAGFIQPFLGYFILRRDDQRSKYTRTSYALKPHEIETVTAFADVFLPAERVISAQEVTWNVERQLSRIQSKRRDSLGLILTLIEHGLPDRSDFVIRSPFSKMTKEERRRFVEDWFPKAGLDVLRDLAKIKTLVIAGYYGDERVFPSIGFEKVSERPQYDANTYKPKSQPAVTVIENPPETIECDVCVIGSGAGGAVVAGTLAPHKDVVLLEEGDHVRAEDITHDEPRMSARLYKEGGLQTTVDFDMLLLQGRALGGSTVINNAIGFDLRPDVLAEWAGLGAKVNAAKLQESFKTIRKETGTVPFDQYAEPGLANIAGKNPALLTGGWNAIPNAPPREHGFFDKNKNDCLGCGYCNFGCPYGRKLSMLETYVPKLTQHGRRIIVGCHAVKIETDNNRATEIRCEMKDGRKVTVRAKDSIVLSCGVIGSSVLLMKSGIKVRHHGQDLVGSRVSFNAASPLFGLYSDRVRGFDGMQMGAYIGATEGGVTGDYLMESHFDPPMTFAASLPGWFEKHFARMKQYPHFVSAGVLIRTEANGSIKSSPEARDLLGPVDYQMLPGDLAKIRRGMSEVAAAWFQSGAKLVMPSTFRDVELGVQQWLGKAPAEIEAELSKHIKKPDDITLSSAHLQGGNPMSDGDLGVVDSQFKVKGFDNLFVCDASVFPSSVGVNPQLTIMAMADYLVGLGVV